MHEAVERPAAVSSAERNREVIASMVDRRAAARPDERASWLSDDKLIALLDEGSEWTGHDKAGVVVFTTGTLRSAVELATASVEPEIAAICRRPGDSVIVFKPQIAMLAAAITSPE